MAQRLLRFLVVCIFIFHNQAKAQQQTVLKTVAFQFSLEKQSKYNKPRTDRTNLLNDCHFDATGKKTYYQILLRKTQGHLQVVPENFYTNKMGFFCKQEWKFEKHSLIPFKFRLGSVLQSDYLEGKNNRY